jgi:ribosomal protein L40E
MANDSSQPCPSCGARIPTDADRCDLCGAAIPEDVPSDDAPSDEPDAPTAGRPSAQGKESTPLPDPAPDAEDTSSEDAETEGVFCTQCGWQNPTGANFCSRCGTELQDVSPAGVPEGTRPVSADLPRGAASSDPSPQDSDAEATDADATEDAEQAALGNRILLYVGSAAAAVVALFFVTLWSQSQTWSSEEANRPEASSQTTQQPGAASGGPAPGSGPSAGGAPSGGAMTTDLKQLAQETGSEIPSTVSTRVDSLRQVVETASGATKQRAQGQLVNMYVGAGQTGRAAVLQQSIAETSDSTEAWRRAGDLLYRWMQQFQQQGQRRQAFPVAQAAATAYETVAERVPDDLRARTRMGESYLLTNSPMKGIQTINDVLAEDSTFVPARFQKGLAFLQISRFEQAIAEFERVKQFSSEGEPYYRQADRAIQIIRERTQPTSGDGASSSGAVQEP